MATAKIATLLIRTLAKPIATQLKTQAASHESFRRVCVGIAQTMHKTEMALRYNLLPKAAAPSPPPQQQKTHSDEESASNKTSTESHAHAHDKDKEHTSPSHTRPRVRPLNEAKAIANGASFLAEAFLFSIAAGLVIAETWRSSKKTSQRRERTQDDIEQLEVALRKLCLFQRIDPRSIGLDEHQRGEQNAPDADDDADEDARAEAARHAAAAQHRLAEENELKRLQKAVDVLLRMAISNGSIMGNEALNLQSILDGKDARQGDGADVDTSPSQQGESPSPQSSPILSEIAQRRAKELAEMSRA